MSPVPARLGWWRPSIPGLSRGLGLVIVVLPAQVGHGVIRPLGARVECPPTHALHDPQVAAAVHADAGGPRVGQFLPTGSPDGDGLAAGLSHVVILSRAPLPLPGLRALMAPVSSGVERVGRRGCRPRSRTGSLPVRLSAPVAVPPPASW